jgi:Holliday junction resolvase RusA-like endonuclease
VTSEVVTIRAIEEGWDIFLPLSPVPAARPKVGRFNTYYPKTYQTWKTQAERMLKQVVTDFEPTDEGVHVFLEQVKVKARTSKLVRPKGDVDNFAKATLDAITKSGKIWIDDDQVVSLATHKRFAYPGEEAHTLVRVGLTLGAVWEGLPVGYSEDFYDLPAGLRVPLEDIADA